MKPKQCVHSRDFWRVSPDHTLVVCLKCCEEDLLDEEAIETTRVMPALEGVGTVPPCCNCSH